MNLAGEVVIIRHSLYKCENNFTASTSWTLLAVYVVGNAAYMLPKTQN